MKALTIQQAWAWAIHARHKCVENRTWSTSYRGALAIHAGKGTSWLSDSRKWMWHELGIIVPDGDLIFGAVLGVAQLVDVVKYDRCKELQTDPWASGPWCWRLEDYKPLREPVVYRGAQGLFEIPDELLAVAM